METHVFYLKLGNAVNLEPNNHNRKIVLDARVCSLKVLNNKIYQQMLQSSHFTLSDVYFHNDLLKSHCVCLQFDM